MKILKEGTWENPWSHEFTCTENDCRAELLVEEADVKAPDYTDSNRFTFECAVCGHTNVIPANGLPLRIKKTLNATRKYSSSSLD